MQLAEPVLEEIAIELIEYLQYYFNEEILGDKLETFKNHATNLMHMVRDLVHECVCNAFVILFTDEVTELNKIQTEVPAGSMRSVKLISFYLKELYKTE